MGLSPSAVAFFRARLRLLAQGRPAVLAARGPRRARCRGCGFVRLHRAFMRSRRCSDRRRRPLPVSLDVLLRLAFPAALFFASLLVSLLLAWLGI